MLLECYVTMAKFGGMPEAVTAFDTTNNTGKSLSTADLLRYWMLRNARHPEVGIENIDEKWNKINDVLEDKDKDIKDFVVRYWCGRLESGTGLQGSETPRRRNGFHIQGKQDACRI